MTIDREELEDAITLMLDAVETVCSITIHPDAQEIIREIVQNQI